MGPASMRRSPRRLTSARMPQILPPEFRGNREMIDPASNTIEPGHHCTNQLSLHFGDQEELRLNLELVVDHRLGRVSRWIVWEDASPQCDQRLPVRRLERPYRK